ncbi:efflux RND transporter periplasmic adaptor subunit [Acuticoccus sp. I52.16.1]|uniref:efflux RND transporter periplasmic adaptor subunit n=1 Tax=Acuticoccus sp. I52.16.1 TaxID=2928472 RepID=UPI001FD6178A|nr:efflux RND transporter periplasmic adaptor subunit [Acuticoccus sp. I52.16.1]UOM34355.1 efflux RND transporter periplasmic adaptor subunit [Acuticoccus sp. I52.16.1]
MSSPPTAAADAARCVRRIAVRLALLAGPLAAAGLPLSGPASAQEPLVVEFVTVETRPVSTRYEATGEVAARETISAAFPDGGRVVEVHFDEGDRVKAGTVLARIDDTQQRESLNAAQATLRAEEATLSEAKADEARQARLLDRGFTTRATRDTALQTLRAAQSAVAQARAEVEQAQTDLDDTVLKAPVDAVVTDRTAEEGQVLGAAEAAFTLAPQGQLDAVFDVPDSLFIDPPARFDISLRLIEDPAVEMTGEVREVSPLVNEETGAVEITVTITDPPAGVQIGAPIRGAITLPARPVIQLPWTALTATDSGLAVWIVGDDETVSLRNIEVSRFETGRFTVAAGLEVGETVVGEGSSFVFPGRHVVAAQVRP